MSIEVEQLESWIGSEARGSSGEKLGKIEDVYFAGTDPVAIAIRSGLGGRKHHAATLKGAGVTHDGVRLAIGEDDLVSTDGGHLTDAQISALSAQDDRLRDVRPERLESWQQREQRHQEAEEARTKAEELEAEAQLLGEEEEKAASRAGDAESNADEARREREEAEARARQARAAADRTEQG